MNRIETNAAIHDARDDETLQTWLIEQIDGRWIVYRETHNGVEAFDCSWEGMTAVADTVAGLVRATSAKTYNTKSAAAAAVRRASWDHEQVAVRGNHIHIF